MKFYLHGLVSLILTSPQILATEKSCNEIIETVNEISLTEDFWAYLKELIQNKQLKAEQLVRFYQSLDGRKFANPISHQMTNMGPVFKNSSDMIHYKKIAQYLEALQSIDLKFIKNKLEREFENLNIITQQKSIVTQMTKSILIKESFIETVRTNKFAFQSHPLFQNLFIEILKPNPSEASQIAREMLSSDKGLGKRVASDLLKETKLLESNLDLFKDYEFIINGFDFDIKNLNDPLNFIKFVIANGNSDSTIEAILYNLDKDKSINITLFYKELLSSPKKIVKILAHHYYIKRSQTDGLQLARQVFIDNPTDKLFLVNTARALSNYKSDEAVQFMHEIFGNKDIDPNVKDNLFSEFDGNTTPLHFKLIEKAINFRFLHENHPGEIKDVFKALSICKGPEAFKLIKSLVKSNSGLLKSIKSGESAPLRYVYLIENRPEKEVYDLARPYLESINWSLQGQAIHAISQLKLTETRDAIFKFVIAKQNPRVLDYVIQGMKNHDTEFLLPIIEYYRDNERPPMELFSILKGRTDTISLEFAVSNLKKEDTYTITFALSNLAFFDDSIKLPILHDFISNTTNIKAKEEALKLLYAKNDPKSLLLMKEALSSHNDRLIFAALPGYIYALLVSNTRSLATNENYKLILDSLALLNEK